MAETGLFEEVLGFSTGSGGGSSRIRKKVYFLVLGVAEILH